jgi:hypothetical protein
MLLTKGVIIEERSRKFLQDLSNDFPVGWAEVSAKWLTAREEQLVMIYENAHVISGCNFIFRKADLTLLA